MLTNRPSLPSRIANSLNYGSVTAELKGSATGLKWRLPAFGQKYLYAAWHVGLMCRASVVIKWKSTAFLLTILFVLTSLTQFLETKMETERKKGKCRLCAMMSNMIKGGKQQSGHWAPSARVLSFAAVVLTSRTMGAIRGRQTVGDESDPPLLCRLLA